MEKSIKPAIRHPFYLNTAKALLPPQTLNAQPKEPSSTAAPIARASQPSPSKTAPPSRPNANSGPSNEGIARTHLPGDKENPEEHEPLTGNVAPVGDSPPSVKSAPFQDNAAEINNPPAGYDQSAGNDPQPGNNIGNSGSSKDSPLDDHQPGHISAGSQPLTDVPARIRPAFTSQIGGHIVQAATITDGVIVDGHYLAPGGDSIVFSVTSIALHTNGDLMLGTSTVHNIFASPASEFNAVFTVGSELVTLASNSLVDGAITLRLDDPSVTIGGTVVSLGRSALLIGTKTIQLGFDIQTIPTTAINVAGQPVKLLPHRIAIAGSTLTANAPVITLAGTPVSFGGNRLIVGTSTVSLRSPFPTSILTVGGQTYTFSRIANGVSIAGKTLQVGQPAVTISGIPIALESSGLVINGTSTIPYQSIVGTSVPSDGIGGFILSAFNLGAAVSASTTASTASNSWQKNTTGPAGGLEAFMGGGGGREVPLGGLAVVAAAILLMTFGCIVF